MLHILRFMDAFQHTYEVVTLGATAPEHDDAFEQAHTFSNIISRRYAWLNLLLLNFGYHNAHHHAMKCPWYQLPKLDQQLFDGDGLPKRESLRGDCKAPAIHPRGCSNPLSSPLQR